MVIHGEGGGRLGRGGVLGRGTHTPDPLDTYSYKGETHESDGYTMEWSHTEDSSIQSTYLVSEFSGLVEQDFEFPDSVAEKGRELDADEETEDRLEIEDRSLGEASVALSEK